METFAALSPEYTAWIFHARGSVIFADGSTYSSTGLANLLSETIVGGTLASLANVLSITATPFYPKKKTKWHARIMFQRKLYLLGFFNTPEEAHAAYAQKAAELHGEFARTA
jgi:hypothetical protein